MDCGGDNTYTYINLLMIGCSVCAMFAIIILTVYMNKKH